MRLAHPQARMEAISSRSLLLSGVGRKTSHAGQHVAGELDALELQAQRTRQQAGQRQSDLMGVAEDDLFGLVDDVMQ